MRTGLLWFDNDPKHSLVDKILAGAKRYQTKFGMLPNCCFVHPGTLEKENTRIENMQVSQKSNILPHHFLFSVAEHQQL